MIKNNLPKIAIVILAAGTSSRLGQKKQLLSWNNHTLLENTVVAAQNTGLYTMVVIPPEDAQIKSIVRNCGVSFVENEKNIEGVSTSICLGLKSVLTQEPELEGAIFSVCDQPFLCTALLQKIVNYFVSSKIGIVASQYANTVGIPVLFAKKYFNEILQLKGDQGAKKIIYRNKDHCHFISFDKGEIDIDTMEDYASALEH